MAEQLAELRWRRTPEADRAKVTLEPGVTVRAACSTTLPFFQSIEKRDDDEELECIETETSATVQMYLGSWVLVRTPSGDKYWVAKADVMPSYFSKFSKFIRKMRRSPMDQQSRQERESITRQPERHDAIEMMPLDT